ncbi:AAA family ATPase [Candidatus Poriferisodalis sp.]|uniref:AAA family ATPase n=1 Tax=Candidatus Poriferisodalis sp. TaxID=3101277 RepID=UPI003AF57A2C
MNTETSQAVALSPRGVLIEWANRQQSWVRYLVGEVLAAAGPVGREVVDGAFAIFLAEDGLSDDADFTGIPALVDEGHLGSGDDPIRLLKLSNVHGVNALAPNQSIEFGRGLTVLYGQNGVGKTGYARVIKRAAGSREHEDILGNIDSAGVPVPPSAEFEVEIGASQHSIAWNNEVGIEHIRRIAVFDSATAEVHVDDDLNYVFTPAELARFDDVTKALQDVQESIGKRAEEHASRTQLSPNPFTPDSAVHRSVENITESTLMDAIRQLAQVAPDAEETLQHKRAEAAALAAGTESAQARELERQVGEVAEAVDILTALTAFDVEAYNVAVASVNQGREAVALLRSTLSASTPAGLPLDEHWESFVRAGADYASHSDLDAYPTEESVCLYCGQHLGDDAHRLIVLYGEFLNSAAQQQLDAAERELAHTLPQIDEGRLERSLEMPTAFPEPQDLLVRAEKVCRDAQGSLLQIANRQHCSDAELFDRAQQLIEPLAQLREGVKQRLNDLAEQHERKSDVLPQLQREIRDLEDAIKLSSHLEAIERCIEQAQVAARLNANNERTSSQTRRSLTLAAKRASEDAMNHSFEELFKQECVSLGARTVSLDFQARRGKAERAKHMGTHRPSAVLSEGEQKMLALADFLAECRTDGQGSPLLFDDPVSSLDERGIEGVTKRLCELAKERQVIVFTHNIMFAAALLEGNRGTPTRTTCIEVRDQGTDLKGVIGLNVEPRLDTPENLAKKTNKAIQEAGAESDFERQDRLISEAYSLMRSWCEAFVEQRLFQSVTQRFRAHVMMTNLKDVRVDRLDGAIAVIGPMFAKISRYVTAHSQAFEQQNTKPKIQDLKDDWKELTDARDRYAG